MPEGRDHGMEKRERGGMERKSVCVGGGGEGGRERERE